MNNVIDLAPLLQPGRSPCGNAARVQAALEAYTPDPWLGALVKIPSGVYTLEGPVHLPWGNVTVRGESKHSTQLFFSRLWSPGFVFGVGQRTLPASRRVKLDGLLDGTVGGYGIATGGDTLWVGTNNATTMGQVSPKWADATGNSHWDDYGEIDEFTLEIAFRLPSGPKPDGVIATVGMGGDSNWPGVWGLWCRSEKPTDLEFVFQTSDPADPYHTPNSRRAVFPLPAPDAKGVYRASISVFVKHNSALVVDARTYESLPATLIGAFKPGHNLRPNIEKRPFCAGALVDQVRPGAAAFDVEILGLKFANIVTPLRFKDVESYWSDEGNTTVFRLFAADDDPASRYASVWSLTRAAQLGHLVAVDATCQPMRDVTFENMTIRGGSPSLLLGTYTDVNVRDVDFLANGCTFGQIPLGASYPLRFRDCLMEGLDGVGQARDSTVQLRDCQVTSFRGRKMIMLDGAEILIDEMLVRHGSVTAEHVIDSTQSNYGGDYVIRGFRYDNEGEPGNLMRSVFRFGTRTTGSTTATVERLKTAYVGSAAAIELHGGGDERNSIWAQHLDVNNPEGVALRIAGSAYWQGGVDAYQCRSIRDVEDLQPDTVSSPVQVNWRSPQPDPGPGPAKDSVNTG